MRHPSSQSPPRARRGLTAFRLAMLLLSGSLLASAGVVFDDSAPGRIVVSNGSYQVSLSKTDGHFLDIVDTTIGRSVTAGSQAGCLWSATVAAASGNRFTGGCGFSPLGMNQFRYTWDASRAMLQLNYVSAGTDQPSAVVAFTFSSEPYFEMSLALQNQTDGVIEAVGVPASLIFPVGQIQSAYLPFLLPGTKLRQVFFLTGNSLAETYPSQLCFADFQALEVNGSLLAIYTVDPDSGIQPLLLGVFGGKDAPPGMVINAHRFETNIARGASYMSPVVRIQVGGTVPQVLAADRHDNKIDSYPSVAQKLGSRFEAISRSPLVRADFQLFNRTFAKWTAELDKIRAPAIVHPVGFQVGGHDHSYPDLLPPNPAFGTTADFRRFADAAAGRGLFVMPHTNYTWWNPDSPTLQSLTPSEIASLSVLDKTGQPDYETVGNGQESNSGYVVSPSVASVRSRIQTAWKQWNSDVGINMLFLDQVGARPWMPDYNPAAPSILSYPDQWIGLIDSASSMMPATEGGYDRLSKDFWAFFGSALSGPNSSFNPKQAQWGVNSPANFLFGQGSWEPYPIATLLFHDKVLFYQHNLQLPSYSTNTEVLSWNALFGYNQIFLWPGTPGAAPDEDWINLAQSLQRAVASRQAGVAMDDFEKPSANLAYSKFGNIETFANWDVNQVYTAEEGQIAPSGFLSRSVDGKLVAGLFQGRFGPQSLSPGMHAILVERDPALVTVRHPVGLPTTLSVQAPDRWSQGDPTTALAVDRDNDVIGPVGVTVSGSQISFSTASMNGRSPSSFLFQTGGEQITCTDAAAFELGPVSPGLIVSVFGSNIGPEQAQKAQLDSGGAITTELAGEKLLFHGTPAPLLYVSRDQINAIVPYSVASWDSVPVELVKDGATAASVTVPVVNAVPRLFTSDGTGSGQVAAVNDDGTINTAQRPVSRGGIISLYGTGGGLESVAAADGELARDASRTARLPVTVRIAGRTADVLYAGAAPGFAGMLQVNVRVPILIAGGDAVQVELSVGGAPSQSGATIAVK